LEKEGAGLDLLEKLTLGSLGRAVTDGDFKKGSFMAGQIAGLVKEIRPCSEIIESIVSDAQKTIKDMSERFGEI